VSATGGSAELISMWVAPAWRGRGVASQLIEAVADWAASEALSEIRLWVVEGNQRAERAYAKAGFQRTGAVQPVRPREPAMEFEMSRPL
jgi:GNAT superfamily N-acetyltransferase